MILDMLSETSSWNSRAQFHVILLKMRNERKTLITDILASFWRYLVFNIIINVVADESGFNTNIFTWMPFEKGNCGENTSDFIEVGSCRDPEDGNLFPDKVTHEMS